MDGRGEALPPMLPAILRDWNRREENLEEQRGKRHFPDWVELSPVKKYVLTPEGQRIFSGRGKKSHLFERPHLKPDEFGQTTFGRLTKRPEAALAS